MTGHGTLEADDDCVENVLDRHRDLTSRIANVNVSMPATQESSIHFVTPSLNNACDLDGMVFVWSLKYLFEDFGSKHD